MKNAQAEKGKSKFKYGKGMILCNYKSQNLKIIINIFDVTVLGGKRIGEKENEKVKTYQKRYREIARIQKKITLRVVPLVLGLSGGVAKNMDKLGTRTSIHH